MLEKPQISSHLTFTRLECSLQRLFMSIRSWRRKKAESPRKNAGWKMRGRKYSPPVGVVERIISNQNWPTSEKSCYMLSNPLKKIGTREARKNHSKSPSDSRMICHLLPQRKRKRSILIRLLTKRIKLKWVKAAKTPTLEILLLNSNLKREP